MRNSIAVGVMVSVALAAAGAGCRSKLPSPRPVAQVGTHPIYLGDVDRTIAEDVFELRSGALHKLIADDLIREEAKRRGVSLKDLWRLEVDQKVPVPDDETTRKTVDGWIADGRMTSDEAGRMSLGQAKDRVRRFNLHVREQAYYDSLFEHGAVNVDYAALGKPALKITTDGPAVGPADAPITVVEFADLTKSFTSIWQPTLERLLDAYGSKVRFVFKQKPENVDSPAATVAEASLCANDQQRYWEFRKALLHDGRAVGPELVTAAATSAGLDVAQLEACLASGRNRSNVARNVAEAVSNNLEGEPVVSVNGIRLSGAQPFGAVDKLLKNELAKL